MKTAHPTTHADKQFRDGKMTAVCYNGMGAAMVELQFVDNTERIFRWHCPWCNSLVVTVKV